MDAKLALMKMQFDMQARKLDIKMLGKPVCYPPLFGPPCLVSVYFFFCCLSIIFV